MLMRRVLPALALLIALAAPGVSSAATSPVRFHDAPGIHVVATKRYDARQYNVKVLSPALGRPVDIRILLPREYDASRHYPVLYLFHGTSGGASDWVDKGAAEATTDGLPVITVMPDAGFNFDGGGWFTDWVDARPPRARRAGDVPHQGRGPVDRRQPQHHRQPHRPRDRRTVPRRVRLDDLRGTAPRHVLLSRVVLRRARDRP